VRRFPSLILALLAPLSICCGLARGATAATPSAARELRLFDFEERAQGNLESLPMGWLKVTGDGMPHYVKGEFDELVARSGTTSFRLDLNGGSVVYRYPAGKIKVYDDALYRVVAYVKTTPLKFARARVTAYFADVDGNPIVDSVVSTEPYASPEDSTEWHRVDVRMPAHHPGAASLVLELGLLQPSQLGNSNLGARDISVEDIRGSAWFDDVAVAQVPDVRITTDRPANIFPRSAPVRVAISVKDRNTRDLAAKIEVRSAAGELVYQRNGMLSVNADDARRGELNGILELPRLRAGWYRASIELSSGGQYVGSQDMQFIQLGDDDDVAVAPADPRFGLDATSLPPDVWPGLPTLLRGTGFGRVKFAIWQQDRSVSEEMSGAFTRMLAEFRNREVQLTGVLAAIPPDVRRATGASNWIDLLTTGGTAWQERYAYLVSRHANHLRYWQLYTDSQAEQIAREPKLRQVYDRLLAEHKKVQANPDLALPWPAWYELDGELPATVSLVVPSQVLPDQLSLYASEVLSKPGHRLSLYLRPIDREKYGRNEQIRDLALRIGNALACGAERVDVPLWLDVRQEQPGLSNRDVKLSIEPDELFLVSRTLTARLANATFRGRVPLAPDVDAFIFEREGGGGVMLVWNKASWSRAGAERVTRITATLGGTSPRIVDLFGNESVPTAIANELRRGKQSRFAFDVGAMPVLIDGVDAQLLRFGAMIALDNPLLESSFEAHARKLKITNTFSTSVSGSVRLRGPAGWTLTMPVNSFSLNPGETVDLPVTIEFPFNSFAGEKIVNAEVEVQGAIDYQVVVPIPLKLGLSDVGVRTLALRTDDEIVVQQVISNYGDKPIDYTAFVAIPGYPRQERLVTNLGPGRSTIKKYRIPLKPGPAETLKVRSGVRELDGVRVLNELVEVN
jgi:hypothetical protein